MIFLLLLFSLTGLSFYLLIKTDKDIYLFTSIILGLMVIIYCLLWPLSYYGSKAQVRQYYALKETVMKARTNNDISEFELAALQQKIIDNNVNLVEVQYFNSLWVTDLWITDEVDELKLLE